MSKEDVRKLVGTDSLVIGNDEVTKLLRKGELAKVFVASNASPATKAELQRYAGLGNADFEELEVPNEEVGVLCRKPFSVSVVGKKK